MAPCIIAPLASVGGVDIGGGGGAAGGGVVAAGGGRGHSGAGSVRGGGGVSMYASSWRKVGKLISSLSLMGIIVVQSFSKLVRRRVGAEVHKGAVLLGVPPLSCCYTNTTPPPLTLTFEKPRAWKTDASVLEATPKGDLTKSKVKTRMCPQFSLIATGFTATLVHPLNLLIRRARVLRGAADRMSWMLRMRGRERKRVPFSWRRLPPQRSHVTALSPSRISGSVNAMKHSWIVCLPG